MTKTHRLLTLLFAIALLGAPVALEAQFNTNVNDSDRADCSAIEVTSDDYEVAHAEEVLTTLSGPVRVTAPRNGGVWITGSDGALEVRACKFAASRERSDADAQLTGIHVQAGGNEISAEGPGSGRWVVYFIVRAPRGASVTATTTNGPISIRAVDGTVVARATNGPIGIKDSRGQIDAETVNGPISVAGSSGELKLTAQNGPLAVKLDGAEWDGPGLQGRTENGPLTLTLPADYRSGVVVQADGRSPFRCSGCTDARRTWDDETRRIEFGPSPERIRLTTNNGPVTVKR